MLTAFIIASAAEISGLQFASDCASVEHSVTLADGEATTISFASDWSLVLAPQSDDVSRSLSCRITLQLAPPTGFRAGIDGVRVSGSATTGTDRSLDLTVRVGAPGLPSHAALTRELKDNGIFTVDLGGGTLWFGCGEVAPEYSVSLDLSAFQTAGAAFGIQARIGTVSVGAIIYRRCDETAPK